MQMTTSDFKCVLAVAETNANQLGLTVDGFLLLCLSRLVHNTDCSFWRFLHREPGII